MSEYYRAIPSIDPSRSGDSLQLAGGWTWFDTVEVLRRDGPAERVRLQDVPANVLEAIASRRSEIAGINFEAPRLMGILNVTPDSFSDGGQHAEAQAAKARALRMVGEGADIIDVGGESTRPGADEVSVDEEIARVAPAIAAIAPDLGAPISIDTRKRAVAEAAVSAGAGLVNDVSGFTFDAELAPYCADNGLPVCVMHAQGLPGSMQDDPRYDDVLLDIYDFLAARVNVLTSLGIHRNRIIVDPGIGFGKTQAHNLAILQRLSLFHSLGCPILLGASRKGFIRDIGRAPDPADRAPGSIAVALAAVAQGVQILRVHDVAETRQALALWRAATEGTAT